LKPANPAIPEIPVRRINKTQQEPGLTGSFSIRDLRDLLDGKDMVQQHHRHDFFFILALKKGSGSHEIDFTPYQIQDHSIFMMRPGQVHQLTLKSQSRGYLVAFNKDFYYPADKSSSQLLRMVSDKNLCTPGADGFRKLLAILHNVFKEYTDKKERYRDVIKAHLGIFFIELLRHRQKRRQPLNNPNAYTQERLEEFLQLVEADIAHHKQVSHYAGLLNLSPFQLNAITKATLGKTSSEIINDYIVLESKRHLLATSSQVSQIAYQLGYEDASYFIRFFKKHTGLSPEAFRNNFR
jgi:AraC family transcriptional activator of pobA